ncbi:replication initiation and membrane attachment family protein [Paenisporosarcina indica]|uniref:replication initiation and membrane attachment family protein n=1 Tax=Paenisporosarcina indica TaxID=650093 RepID=UPI00094F9386|nr:DnaD domain protein [Paenisporosarcina indica]
MQLLFKELQPVDSFIIQMPYPLADRDRHLVTMLYKPIVGSDAMSLYFTLWSESEAQTVEELTHYYLMDVLNMSLKKIFDARVALEAIGLMKSWKKDNELKRTFIYEILSPLDAATFFSEPILATSLYSVIHEKAYLRIRERFVKKPLLQSGYENVSRDLQDVFKSNHDYTKLSHIFTPEQLDQPSRPKKLPLYSLDFDFDLLKSGLSDVMIPSNVLTLPIKELIAKVAFLYSLNAIDMQKVLMMAIDDQNRITEERLKKTAADYYKLSISSKPPRITQKLEQQSEAVPQEGKPSKDQALIKYMEETPPLEVLRDISNGNEPLPVEVDLANELIFKYGFPPAVVNVLLQFVLIRAKKKLNKNYVHKIAAHWQRENIQTAEQAIEISRKEHDQYMEWQNAAKTPAAPYKRKNVREEKVPEWFFKAKEERDTNSVTENTVSPELKEQRRKLLEELGIKEGKVN